MDRKVDNLIKASMDEGHEIYFEILENYPQLDENDTRSLGVIFALMTCCIGHLHMAGWSERELVAEVFEHCEQARTMFGPDDKME